MDIPVVYEDEHLLAINKPVGLVVNRAESVRGQTLQDWADKKLRIETGSVIPGADDFIGRSGIVHRIDKETSGLLLLAKNPDVFHKLQQQFKDRLIKKTYIALAHGRLVPETGVINAPVGRLPWNRERFGIVPGGREAITRYKVLEAYSLDKESLTLVELYPETGRTHQIRVHLKYINHPIVGDYLYAGRKTSRADRTGTASRVMLHAYKISLLHPVSGLQLALEAPMPDDMIAVISHDT